MVLYMKVTNDKYELPVAIADSAAELARMVGVKAQTIYECISPSRIKSGKNYGYYKIAVEDDD